MRNKFCFSGIAAVGTAIRQWSFGKSKAGADVGGFGLASEPEEQEEIGGFRIALLILLASLTTLALWAYDYDSDCKALRDRFCAVADKRCRNENSLDGVWQSTQTKWSNGSAYQVCGELDQHYYMGKTDCNESSSTCTYEIEITLFEDPGCTGKILFVSDPIEHTRNITVGTLSGEDCTWEGPW